MFPPPAVLRPQCRVWRDACGMVLGEVGLGLLGSVASAPDTAGMMPWHVPLFPSLLDSCEHDNWLHAFCPASLGVGRYTRNIV